jgi:hypothetical protein
MNYALALSCGIFGILAYGWFLYVRRKRIERFNSSHIDIPAFLRSENVGNNPVSDGEVNTTRVCRMKR